MTNEYLQKRKNYEDFFRKEATKIYFLRPMCKDTGQSNLQRPVYLQKRTKYTSRMNVAKQPFNSIASSRETIKGTIK